MVTVTTLETEEPPKKKASLWHHANFVKLWTSDTISQFGTQFSGWAIPFTALLLTSDPLLFSLIGVMTFLPFPLFALFIGVYVDRHHRKRIMSLANVGRGISLGLIPVAAVTGVLSQLGMILLYAVSFSVGLLTVFFDVSYQAILPSLVTREQLVEGNSKLEISRSSAQVAGPFMAGIVVQAVYPPYALAIDATSYMASAGVISGIQAQETLQPSNRSVWHDLREGLAVVLGDSRLRMIAGSTATSNLFSNALFPVTFLYLAKTLGFGPLLFGFIGAVGATGLLAGILVSSKIMPRIGLGWTIIAGMLIGGIGTIPYMIVNPSLANPTFATLGPIPAIGIVRIDTNVLILMLANFIISIGVIVYNINQVSFRQALVPLRLQGRMNASMRWLVWGTIPLGGFLGGILGKYVGLRPAIEIAVLGGILSFLWVFFSPIRLTRKMPEPLE